MSENLAIADSVEVENQPEEFSDAISEAQARFDKHEIETLQRKFGVEPKSTNGTEDTGKKGSQGKKSGNGIDAIASEVETKLGKDKAQAVRKIHSDYSKAAGRAATAERALSEMTERIARLESTLQPPQEAVPDPLLARVTPQQWEMFDRMAAEKGYVRREDLEAAQRNETAAEYNEREVQEAQDRFGESFGTFDDSGKFILSDEAFEAIQKESDRVFNPTYGITAKDLYVLANWQQLLDEDRGNGRPSRMAEEAEEELPPSPPPRQRRVFTERNSAPVGGRPSSYTRGTDSLEDVVRKAAIRQLRSS